MYDMMHYKGGKLLIVVEEGRMRSHSSSPTARQQQSGSPPSSLLSLIMTNHLSLSLCLSHCGPPSLHLATWYLIRHLCFQHTQCKLLLAGPVRAQGPSGGRTHSFLSVCVCVVCTGECKQRGVWCVHPPLVLSRPGGCSRRTSQRNKWSVRSYRRGAQTTLPLLAHIYIYINLNNTY